MTYDVRPRQNVEYNFISVRSMTMTMTIKADLLDENNCNNYT